MTNWRVVHRVVNGQFAAVGLTPAVDIGTHYLLESSGTKRYRVRTVTSNYVNIQYHTIGHYRDFDTAMMVLRFESGAV